MSSRIGATAGRLDAEHREFRAVCRTFTDRHVLPAVGEAEALGPLPRRLWKELGAAGLLGLLTPEEHGGSGGDQLAVIVPAGEADVVAVVIKNGTS